MKAVFPSTQHSAWPTVKAEIWLEWMNEFPFSLLFAVFFMRLLSPGPLPTGYSRILTPLRRPHGVSPTETLTETVSGPSPLWSFILFFLLSHWFPESLWQTSSTVSEGEKHVIIMCVHVWAHMPHRRSSPTASRFLTWFPECNKDDRIPRSRSQTRHSRACDPHGLPRPWFLICEV